MRSWSARAASFAAALLLLVAGAAAALALREAFEYDAWPAAPVPERPLKRGPEPEGPRGNGGCSGRAAILRAPDRDRDRERGLKVEAASCR